MKKIAITGGFGFIGARMTSHFLNKGKEVIILEHPSAVKPAGFPDVEVVPFDMTNEQVNEIPQLKNCDALLHLAAQSSGPKSFTIPAQDITLNILGTLNTINLCDKNSIGNILFASSFVVYGDHPDRESLDETANCKPKSVYAGSKLAAEHLLANYAGPKGIRWNALRMFNVYGPGQDITKPDQGVVGIFMNMLLKSNTIHVKGSLSRFRDLVFIDDVIAGWDHCLNNSRENGIYNLGSGVKTTFEELIHNTAVVLRKEKEYVIDQQPGMPGDMQGCYADMTKAGKHLNFFPKVALSEGVEQLYTWVLANKK